MAIDKRGSSYRVRIKKDGRVIATRSFASAAEAAEWQSNYFRYYPSPDEGTPSETLLGHFLGMYLEEVVSRQKGKMQNSYVVRYWIRSALARKPIGSVTRWDIQKWIDTETKAKRAPSTIRRMVSILKQVFKYAKRSRQFQSIINPCEGVVYPRTRSPVFVKYSESYIECLTYHARLPGSPYMEHLVKLAIATGMRRGELLSLTWDNVFEKHVHLPDTKSGKAQDRPLSSAARAVLAEWKRITPYKGERVFPVTGTQVFKAFATLRNRLVKQGYPHVTFHGLRHIAATEMAKKLPNALVLARALGHASPSMTYTYYNPQASDIADMLD